MAQTLKFGNGEWATKDGSVLAYNDENSNYKPLPFDFSRASKATVINKNGLIEEVGSGQPRIDYLDNTKGSMLLEPSRTNLITQSEAFSNSYWTKSGASIEGDASTAGSEEIVNGDFATDTDWAKESGWAIGSGTANATAITLAASLNQIPSSLVVGKTYLLTYTVLNYVSGNIKGIVGLDNTSLATSRNSNGTYSQYFYASGVLQVRFQNAGSTFTGSIDNVSVKEVQGFSAPSVDSPLGAFKLVEDTSTGGHRVYAIASITSGQKYAQSFYAKQGERSVVQLAFGGKFSSTDYANFDLSNGTVSAEVGSIDAKIEALSNGWYRCSAFSTAVITGTEASYIQIQNSTTATRFASYTGDGTSGVYIFGAQLEQASYPTSYIKTEGTAQTRLADTCSQTPPDGVIGQTEGVAYVEVDWKGNDEESIFGVLHNGTSYRMDFGYSATFNSFYFNVRNGGGQGLMQYANPTIGKYKIAVVYKNNDFALWVNGINEASDNSGTVPITTTYNVGNYIGGGREYPIINSKLYNTRLSNSELATLTS